MENQPSRTTGVAASFWTHWWIPALMLLGVVALDVVRPWNRDFSILYLVPVLYAGWATSSRSLCILMACSVVTVFLVPAVTGSGRLSTGAIRNRGFGVAIGVVMSYLLWDRRRVATELQWVNRDLESRVAERTAELHAANESLREEIRNRQRTEENLREAQRLEAIGRLAGGIAHDFNNLLTIINGYAELLRDSVRADAEVRHAAEQVGLAGRQAADLTRKLLAFSRRQALQTSVFNLNEVLTRNEGLMRRLLPENIRVVMQLDPSVLPIRADRSALEQAVLNLAANARDAMPNGGQFLLSTSMALSSGEPEAGVPEGRVVPQLRFVVADTGCGMDEVTRQHVFEPFYTTKGVGKGTGLGLASVHGVIRQTGGCIDVASEPGRGTTFTILLPCVTEAPEGVGSVPEGGGVAPGTGTVLVAEDDRSVREFTTLVLRRAGYAVLSAEDGRAAMALIERHPGPIHLLITDVIMPRMSGPELARVFTSERPSTPVLFVSGHAPEELLAKADAVPGAILLPKPYTAQALTAKVAGILASAGDGRGVG